MALIFRVLIGYLIACLVAGLSTVLFAWSPAELAAMQGDAANDKMALTMPVATHIAVFASPLALLAFAFGERNHRRDWLYYALSGVAIALVGFFAQHMSEDARQTWHIADNNYPLFAFIATGFLAGIAYWIFSGRMAGLRPGNSPQVKSPTSTPAAAGNRPAQHK